MLQMKIKIIIAIDGESDFDNFYRFTNSDSTNKR